MRSKFFRLSFVVSLLSLVIASSANAQNPIGHGRFTAKVTLLKPYTVRQVHFLDFGTHMTSTTNQTVNVQPSSPKAGVLVIEGPDGKVKVTAANNGRIKLHNPNSPVDLTGALIIQNQGDFTLASGQTKVSIGGALRISKKATDGVFEGDTTITVVRL